MDQKPIEFAIDDIKIQIVRKVNELAEQYQIPGVLITMILQQILDESKIASYTNYISQLDTADISADEEKPIREIHVNASDLAQQLAEQPEE